MSYSPALATFADRGSAEARAFYQLRVARYMLMYSVLGASFLLLRVVTSLAVGGVDSMLRLQLLEPSFWAHGAAVAFGLGAWLLVRTGDHSMRYLEGVETVCLVGAMISYELMGYLFRPVTAAGSDTVFLALSMGLFVRAIYVPSTARRSFLLAVFTAVPHIVTNYLALAKLPDEVLRQLQQADGPIDRQGFIAVFIGFTSLWWVAAITLTTAASRVIYGLREQVRDIKRLGQYQLEKKIGEGGMGIVYRARHAMLQRPTAVKLLPADKVGEANIARFEREVRLTARLTHPNTVTIFDYGRTPDGVFYYAMELLRGATLDRIVEADGALPPARVVHVLSQAAGALIEAHEVGLIHRDIKPANIMLCEQGGIADTVKVLDFGLVKEIADVGGAATKTDIVKGTPQYLPPEAITHPDEVDARADLYALGAVGFFLVTGEEVFVGRSVVEVCSHHMYTAPRKPSELAKDVPADLEALILKCLAKKREERPQSARELEEALQSCACYGEWRAADARGWWKAHADIAG